MFCWATVSFFLATTRSIWENQPLITNILESRLKII